MYVNPAPATPAAPPPRRGYHRAIRGLLGLGGLAATLTLAGTATLAHLLTSPRRLRTVARREPEGTAEEVTFRTADGLLLHGWYLAPPAPRDALIICHGFAMHCHELLGLAAALRDRGHAVLIFDFRAHGTSEGARSTIGYRETADIVAALDYVEARPEVADLPIGVAGISMGAAATLQAAAREPRIAAVAADSSFAALRDIASNGVRTFCRVPAYPFTPLILRFSELLAGARIAVNAPIDAVGRIAPRPLLIIHDATDRFIPVENAHVLYAAAGEPKELWVGTGLGHASLWVCAPDEYAARLDRFFTAALATAQPHAA